MSIGTVIKQVGIRLTVCKLPTVFRNPVHGRIGLILYLQNGCSHIAAPPGTPAV